MRSRTLLMVVLVAFPLAGCTYLEDLGLARTAPQGPGSLYESYLAGSSDQIVVELDYAPGARWDPDTPAEDQFVEQLERITQKDVVVRDSQDLEGQGSDYAYSLTELRDLHRQHLDTRPGNGTEVMHALFLDGEFQGTVAGLAYAPRAFAVFKGQIDENTCDNDAEICNAPCPTTDPTCLSRTQPGVREWKVTRSVAIHEAGHLLGLVNSPMPMVEDHEMDEDPRPETERHENESHSSNRSSVMFWKTADAKQATQLADDDYVDGGEIPYRFGRLDVADARAVQEGS